MKEFDSIGRGKRQLDRATQTISPDPDGRIITEIARFILTNGRLELDNHNDDRKVAQNRGFAQTRRREESTNRTAQTRTNRFAHKNVSDHIHNEW